MKSAVRVDSGERIISHMAIALTKTDHTANRLLSTKNHVKNESNIRMTDACTKDSIQN